MRELATQQSVTPLGAEQRQAPVAGKLTQTERNQPGATAGPRGSVFSTFRPTDDLSGNPGDLSGNPGEIKDGSGNDATEHRLLTMNDAMNHAPAADAEILDGASLVKPVATQGNPLRLAPATQPSPQQLWSVADPSVQFPLGFAPVTGFRGTVARPVIDETPLPTLYIGNGPSVDDIQQGGIADCYMLAALAGVVQRDPKRLMSMITPDGMGGATIRLWRRKDHDRSMFENVVPIVAPQYDYVQVSVHVSAELCAWKGGGLRGTGVRAASQPQSSAWWTNVESPQLAVHRSDLYQVARWMALFEKAWARLAQDYGQYGGAMDGNAAGGSGYNALDYGYARGALSLIYGPDADTDAAAKTENTTQWSPQASSGAAVLAANQGVIDQLCMVGNRPELSSDQDVDAPNVTCWSNEAEMAKRLGPALQAALADSDFATVGPERQTALQNVWTAWQAWNNAQPDSQVSSPKSDAYRLLVNAAGVAAFTGGANPLQASSPASAITTAMDLMLDLRESGNTFGADQRNIIQSHVYTVMGASFFDACGAPVPLPATPQGQRAAMFPNVDTRRSLVRVRNPWHGGEPDRRGDHVPERAEDGDPNGPTTDGIFTLSLEQFLRNFVNVSSAVFKRS